MANNFTTTSYERTYTSFSGADIKVAFGNRVIGELASITFSVTREKAPIFVFGDPNPRSFSRGKRGIAGSLTFSVFDRDALSDIKQNSTVYRQQFNGSAYRGANGETLLAAHEDTTIGMASNRDFWRQGARPVYSDEIPPFDVSIAFMNEYGQSSELRIYGVEILNEGMGLSIDDITTEKSCTFVARALDDMRADVYEG